MVSASARHKDSVAAKHRLVLHHGFDGSGLCGPL